MSTSRVIMHQLFGLALGRFRRADFGQKRPQNHSDGLS
jgi:hypothetical protein